MGSFLSLRRKMAFSMSLCIILFLSFFGVSFGKFYITPLHLRKLVVNEENIVNTYAGLLQNLSDIRSNEAIQRYMNDYMESSGKLNENKVDKVSKILKHPILAFRMIYRIVKYYPKIQQLLNTTLENIDIPQAEDLEETIDSILTLIFVYDIQLTDFVSGKIGNTQTKFGLNWDHCLEIGKQALKSKYFALAVEWLEVAKYLQNEESVGGKTRNTDIDAMLLQAVEIHDYEFDQTKGYCDKFFLRKLVPNSKFPYEYDGLIHRLKQRTNEARLYTGRTEMDYSEVNFWALCSKASLQSEDEKRNLKCWFETKPNHYWTINPLKVEELSKAPRIIQIYDILPNGVIGRIISTAEPLLEPSLVVGQNETSKASDRTSYSVFLSEDKLKESEYLKRVVETVTGLNVVKKNSSETLQVAAYTFGAYYRFHIDALDTKKGMDTGDRIATFMFYLSDVEEGGKTAFINARVSASPVKGSAVFWYNLDSNGNIDRTTYHGACPVLYGGPKWVANQWIHYNAQFKTSKCVPISSV